MLDNASPSGHVPRLLHIDRRISVRYPCDVGSSCQPVMTGSQVQWGASLQDISHTGVKVLVSRRFEVGTLLQIELPNPDHDAQTMLVRVVRIVGQEEGRWSLGCRFARKLTEDELRALRDATAGEELRDDR